jgi:DNA polymerase-1
MDNLAQKLARPQDDCVRAKSRQRQKRASPSIRSRSTKRPLTPPRTPTSPSAVARAEGAARAESMNTVYETLERPLVPVLARMERRGISIDRQVLSRLSGDFAQTAARLEDEIQKIAGEPINPGSPKQLGDIMFGKMGLPGGTKTKTGAWSTGAKVLEELAEEGHELPKKILEWRQVSKLKSTYTDALPEYVNPQTKRVHTTYALAATTTGRLSSNEPNLQNIPVRTEEGRKIRRAFVATKGTSSFPPITRRSSCACSRRSPTFRSSRRPSATARHSRNDGVGNVRRADEGHAGRSAPPRQGDQLRHHLRHLRLRPRQPARHSAARRPALYQEVFRALSRHPRLHGRDASDFCREHGYVETLFGRKCHYPDIKASNPPCAPSTSAPRSTRGCRAPPPTSSAAR